MSWDTDATGALQEGRELEEQALYQAILSEPHDDAPRLIYADWLDEFADRFGEPLARIERGRAEFIRVQCALARLGPGGWGTDRPANPELERRQKRLLLQYGAKWRRWFPRACVFSV
ncbi:MAG: TIGR02996 domain-containing protein [Planctomycetia bacterium]|nr:TIGR02996 domain-containing protein [Planctomycetia bacterium]